MKTAEKILLIVIAAVITIGAFFFIFSFKMKTSESLTLIGITATAVIGIFNLFLSNGLNRRLKAYELWIQEVHELNVKMHDRLVDIEDAIKSKQRPSEETRKRLIYNASRLLKYDDTIFDDVQLLINPSCHLRVR